MTDPPRSIRFIRHVNDAGCFASDSEMDLIGLVDIGGALGNPGLRGSSIGMSPRGLGMNGRRGGDAGEAQPGRDADTLLCQISYDGGDRQRMLVDGAIVHQSGQRSPIGDTLSIGSQGYMFILATGGRGGDGGRGGNGQPGGVGTRGRNATRFSHGSSGGSGGHGGNAGNPSDGADGGTGGQVTIEVAESDQGLLMLVKGNLVGGDIGFAGERGRGGRGGAGGRGGSSYHWTETSSYTDSQGNRRTRTHFRSNPGGRNGHRGRSGLPSSYRAIDGRQGSAGRLQIIVTRDPQEPLLYDSPFDLELLTFDVAREYDVLEPDSLISIDNLVVRNRGGMPTPDNYPIRIFLESDRWLIRDPVDLVLKQSLEPGESYTFLGSGLRTRIGDYVVDDPRKRPFRLRHWVNPQARMEGGIGRPFRQFENSEQINVRFPVEVSAVTSLNSLAPGESTRVLWSVTNVSQETFDQKYLYRALRSSVRLLDGDMDTKSIVFFDSAGDECDLTHSSCKIPIADLLPGESRAIETRVGIRTSSDIIPYQGFTLGIDLNLQRPKSSDRHEEYRCVDDRKTHIRVSERYLREPDARFLLIANQKTTVNDIERWSQLADYFGSSLDVWDVSYYGFLDLARDVDQGRSLLEQWRGMTIIIPNNYYETPRGMTAAFSQLAKSQFLRAADDFDINFYVVGDSRTGGASRLESALIPIDGVKTPSSLKSEKAFLREVERWNKYIERSKEVVGGATAGVRDFADISLGAVHELDIQPRTIMFQPPRRWLEAKAKELADRLQREDPLHRWVIVHRYDTGDGDTSWGWFKKRQVGTLEVRRTLDSTKGSVVLYEVDSINAIDRDFINSKVNKHGIFLALKFEDKVDRFIRLVGERTFPRYSETYVDRPLSDEEIGEIGTELVDSILVDIFNEQKVVREAKTWGRFHVRALTPKLNYLAERALNYGVTFRKMQENEAGLSLLFDLIASMMYMAEKSKSGWDSVWLPTSFFKRSRAVSDQMRDRAEHIVASIFGREPSWWEKMSGPDDDYDPFGSARKKDVKGIERRTADQEIARRTARLHQENASIRLYAAAQDHPGLTYDPELLPSQARVLSGKTYDRLVAEEARADRSRYEFERSVQAKRSDLLVPLRKTETIQLETKTVTTSQTTT